jgi:type II secretory pathway component GspD/PulD (secretin)
MNKPIALITAVAMCVQGPLCGQEPDQKAAGAIDTAGTWFRDKPINDLFAILAAKGGWQYFYSSDLEGITVTGHIHDNSDPLESMQALGVQHGITLHKKGSTLFALSQKQAALLPRKEFTYQLRYLRSETPEDQNHLIELVKPLASPEGSIRFDPKTSTLMVYDHEPNIEMIRERLVRVDAPKNQVVVDVKILRMSNTRANRSGVDWSQTLGKNGLTMKGSLGGKLDVANFKTLNSALAALTGRVPTPSTTTITTNGSNTVNGVTTATQSTSTIADGGTTNATAGIVIDPITVNAVVRALNEANLATTENGPSIIAEDNETAVFNIIDRVPIIEQTVTQSNGVNNVATDVRYKIGKDDDNNDPKRSREIGVSVTVTPTVLPDGTIRMKLFPRVATITGYQTIATGVAGVTNQVPQVAEAKAESIARIPNGYSLLLGGYYQMDERTNDAKVPLLGDIPLISMAFRSKQREKQRANIAFLITPTAYDPAVPQQTVRVAERITRAQAAPVESEFPDNENPGENEKPNLGQRVRNAFSFGRHQPKPTPVPPPLNTPQKIDEERLKKTLR